MDKHELAAKRLSELGHSTRLCIVRKLIKAGENGLAVGQLQKKIQVPSSTLSHHIARLISVNLVSQERDGVTLICRANLEIIDQVFCYLKAECGC